MYNTRLNGKALESKVCGVAVRMSAAESFPFTSQGGGIFGGGLEQTEGVTERERERNCGRERVK